VAKQKSHRPGRALALGLRAGIDGPAIVPQTKTAKEITYVVQHNLSPPNRSFPALPAT
jgi:hypothetical protein